MASLFNKIKQIFLYASCKDEEEFQSVIENIYRSNMKMLRPMSALTFITTFVLYLLGKYGIIQSTYADIHQTFAMLSGVCAFLVWNEGKEYSKKSFIFLYGFVSIVLAFGVVSGVYFGTDSKAVSFMAILMGVPILFVDRPIRMYALNILSIVIFIKLNMDVKRPELLEADVVNAITYGILGMVLNFYAVKLHMESFLSENKMKVLSEIDLLTGLRNRNAFEDNLSSYAVIAEKSVACIYIDVNGLHEVNNSKGHGAGDRMLKYIAQKTTDIFGKDHCYRIGGDEYVVFVVDQEEKELEEKIHRLNHSVKAQNYSISIGKMRLSQTDIDMKTLINGAEMKMYEAKRNYYFEHGIDRRKCEWKGAQSGENRKYKI